MKNIILFIFITFSILLNFIRPAYSQYQRDWVRSYSNPPNGGLEMFHSTVDHQGNLFLTASCNMVNNNCGAFLMKYDSLGYYQWQEVIGGLGGNSDMPFDIKISRTGFLYLLSAQSYSNGRLTKLDLNGNIIWSTVDSSFSVGTTKMDFDNLGNIVVTGHYNDNSNYMHDMVAKYDTLGNVLWRKQNIPVNWYGGSVILFDSLNNIYAAIGNTFTKYDPNGNVLWTNSVDLYGVGALIFDLQNNLYLVGLTNSTHMIGINKFDLSGNVLWTRTYGPNDGGANSIVTDSDNNIYVAGTTGGSSNPNNINNSVLLKYTSSGNLIWAKTFNGTATVGSNNAYNAVNIMTLKQNTFLLYGAILNSTTLADGFIAKIDTAGQILWQDIYDSNSVQHKCEMWEYLNFDGDSNIYLIGETGTDLGSNWDIVEIMKYNKGYTGMHPSIQGKLYHDDNQNCIKDSVDYSLQGKMIKLLDGTYNVQNYALTDTGGNYYFYAPMGNYIVQPVPPLYWLNTCSGGLNVMLLSNTDSSYNNDLGIFMQPNIQDLRISLAGGQINPAQNTNYFICCENQGTDTMGGRIILKHDSLLSYMNSIPLPDSILPNRLVWNYSDFLCGQTMQIQFTLYADSTLTLLSPIKTMFGIIEPVASDHTPIDNIDSLPQCVFGPFDPNYKSVFVKDTFYSNDTTFTYLVQFQNLGNDTATNVIIRDTLNDQLLLNTLKIGAASYPYTVTFIGNVMFIKFNGISLPPKSISEANSQGCIKYSLSRKLNIALGTKISNRAEIYFDYMPSVLTNRTVNTYYMKTNGIIDLNGEQLLLFPNPTNDEITVKADINKSDNIAIFNIEGQLIKTVTIYKGITSIDVTGLAKGMYFVKLETEKGIVVKKFIKE